MVDLVDDGRTWFKAQVSFGDPDAAQRQPVCLVIGGHSWSRTRSPIPGSPVTRW
jgi:hypothetical protein